jgi:hypothetical protein
MLHESDRYSVLFTYHFFPVIVFGLESSGLSIAKHVGDKGRHWSLGVVGSSVGEF